MRINKLFYYPYRLEIKESFHTSKGVMTHRTGFLILIEDVDRSTGIGEAAPFEEYGSESFETALKILDELKETISTTGLSASFFNDETNLNFWKNYPAVKHGIEQALFHLQCMKKNCSLERIIKHSSRKYVKINSVIGFHSVDKTLEYVKKKFTVGFRTFKVKVGSDSFNDDVKRINAIRNEFPSDIIIRLDANGKWTKSEAAEHLKTLEQFLIEYIEQPVSNIKDFLELSDNTSIPLAADESIRSIEDAEEIINNNYAPVLILKPMMLGGLLNTLSIINKGEGAGKKIIITSTFDSAIGRTMATYLASLLKEDNAHGLDTGHFFVEDLSPQLLPVKNAILTVPSFQNIIPSAILSENEKLITGTY